MLRLELFSQASLKQDLLVLQNELRKERLAYQGYLNLLGLYSSLCSQGRVCIFPLCIMRSPGNLEMLYRLLSIQLQYRLKLIRNYIRIVKLINKHYY